MPATITIELKSLRFFASRGWHEEEALLGNEFEVTFIGTFPVAERITALHDTIDYVKVYEIIKITFEEREKLLETIAQKIASRIEAAFNVVEHMQLTITKLNPLIPAFTGTVGITYTKSFK